MTMNEVKVWCEVCDGGRCTIDGAKCPECYGKGYTLAVMVAGHTTAVSFEQPYDITDAQADAAVLTAIDDYVAVNEIKKAILARLHAFYCGRGAE